MEWIMPGIQKKRVKIMFSTNDPILPVVSIAIGGHKKHKKYRMIIEIILLFLFAMILNCRVLLRIKLKKFVD